MVQDLTSMDELINFINQVFSGVIEQFGSSVYIEFSVPVIKLVDGKIKQVYTDCKLNSYDDFATLYQQILFTDLLIITSHLPSLREFEVVDSRDDRYQVSCGWSEIHQKLRLGNIKNKI